MSAMVFLSWACWVTMGIASYFLGTFAERHRQSRNIELRLSALSIEVKVVRMANAQCERQIGATRFVLMSEVAYAYRLEVWAKGLQDLLTSEPFMTDRTSEIAARMRNDVQTVLESGPPIVDLMSAIDSCDWQRFEQLSGEKRQIQ